jgi:hypothetical protein
MAALPQNVSAGHTQDGYRKSGVHQFRQAVFSGESRGGGSMSKFIFTITAGRTGTAWVADFLAENLRIKSIHEPLAIDDFGNQMPDIRTMRTFNERGLDRFVRQFWERKFGGIQHFQVYAESNHTLAKCGLIEYAAEARQNDEFVFLCIRRNHVDQCLSYVNRGDFRNITIDWQWYLSCRYKRTIMNPEPFLKAMGYLGNIIWYIFEIEARQEYYKILYSEKFQFLDLDLEGMTKMDGARELLQALAWGGAGQPKLSEAKNANKTEDNVELRNHVSRCLGQVDIDPVTIAQDFIAAGRRLGSVSHV